MSTHFQQVSWGEQVDEAARTLIQLAIREDLGNSQDWTSTSLVPREVRGAVAIVAREAGVVAGLPLLELVIDEMAIDVQVSRHAQDGDSVAAGQTIASLSGSAVDLLTAERIMLNFLGRLSGIATLTRRYVDAVADTAAELYDTRKTTPGWRLLEKYAVRMGGGVNHRLGLNRAVMIKDNHVALAQQEGLNLAQAIRHIRQLLDDQSVELEAIEVEVDTLDQLAEVLPMSPDIVLLDNMPVEDLRQAVIMRNHQSPDIVLEASGGVSLATIGAIAKTGVDRISVGALTHSFGTLDIGFDWLKRGEA